MSRPFSIEATAVTEAEGGIEVAVGIAAADGAEAGITAGTIGLVPRLPG